MTCDSKREADGITVFTDLAKISREKEDLEKVGYPVMIVEIPKQNCGKFFTDLHALGVTQVILYTEEHRCDLQASTGLK